MAPRVELIFSGSDQGATATAVSVEEAVKGIGTSAEDANRSITTGMSATLLAFRAVDQSVQQLTADYRAGLVTQQQWEQGMSAARAQAIAFRRETGALSGKELRAFTGVLDNTGKTSSEASFKIDMLKSSTRALAQQAAGVQGPMGGFIQQLLMMAGGSGLVVGVAAAIGLLALAYKALAAEAIKADKAQQDAINRLLAMRKSAEAQLADDLRLARERLAAVNRDLAEAERGLAIARLTGSARDELEILEAIENLTAKRQEAQTAISAPVHAKAAQERVANETAYAGALKATGYQLSILSIRLAHVGGLRNNERLQLRALELEHQGLNKVQIANLLLQEKEMIQLERAIEFQKVSLILLQQQAQFARSLYQIPLRLPSAPKDKPPPEPGTGLIDTDEIGQAEELAHRMTDAFGLSIDMVEDLKSSIDDLANTSVTALGDAFEHVFAAIIEGGRVSGAEMVAGLLGAISKVAIHESAMYLARGFAALAGVIFPVANPANAVAAGHYFKAAAIMGTIGIGAGIAANVAGGGGGRGGLSPDRLREDTRSVQQLERGTLILRVPRTVRAVSPEFVDLVAQAMTDGRERNVILEEDDD